jgi:hypothetical protein
VTRRASVVAAFLLFLGAPEAALAAQASSAEVARLAARATDDPAALRRLRAVDRVDGRPVRIADALGDAHGRVLDARLRALAATPPPGRRTPDASGARREARIILAEDRFRASAVPRPFREALERVGAALSGVVDAIARRVPGGEATVWIALGGLALGVAAVVAARIARRRAAGAAAWRANRGPASSGDDPAALERAAAEAERRGDPAQALRLRFRAGLLRLDAAGAIRLRPSMTAGEAARTVRSPTLAALARDFDEVAYGGGMADPDRVEASRRGWPTVLREAGAR